MIRSTELALNIAASIDGHPEEWRHDGYSLIHDKSGADVWVSNGIPFLAMYRGSSIQGPLGFFGRRRIWAAYKRWTAWKSRQAFVRRPSVFVEPATPRDVRVVGVAAGQAIAEGDAVTITMGGSP